jgi:hypothetical protein
MDDRKGNKMTDLDSEIKRLFVTEGLIAAIRLHRSQTGLYLKESKAYVEKLCVGLNIGHIRRPWGKQPVNSKELIFEAFDMAERIRLLTERNERLIGAIQALLDDYRTEGCANPKCRQCQRSKIALAVAKAVLEEV